MSAAWTPAETWELGTACERNLGKPGAWQRIARQLGRTPTAVRLKAQSLGMYRTADGRTCVNVTQIAYHTGRHHTTVLDWIKRGHLDGLLRRHERYAASYSVEVEALWDWLADIRHWHLYDPAEMPDPDWRAYFAELRTGWIGTAEAAEMLHVCKVRVGQLVRDGLLPGVRTARAIWVRRADVDAYAEARRT
jgi:excisionase family DNA binding protein